MNTKNRSYRGAGFSLAETLWIIAVIAILAAMLLPSTALSQQTNLFPNGTAANQPYYSVSNSVIIGAGTILASDPLAPATVGTISTNSLYQYGTNAAGYPVLPAGVRRSRYVAFGYSATSTNAAAKGTHIAYVDGSTGSGDWLQLIALPVTLSGTSTVSTNATVDTGGLIMFRLRQISNSETNYTSTGTLGISSKDGF